MNGETFSVNEALRFGWANLKRNLGASVALAIVTVGSTFMLDGLAQTSERHAPVTMGVTLLSELVQIVCSFLWVRFALAIHDGRSITMRELFPSGRRLLAFLAVTILYGLLVTAGLILFVIPGLYLAVRYGLVGFLVADGRTDALGAFAESSTLTRGRGVRWKLFLFGLVLVLLNVAGAAFFGIGLFVTIPVSVLASALVYRRLAAWATQDRIIAGPPAAGPPAHAMHAT